MMDELHFPDLYIKGFRGIKDLTVPQLGHVTLITGKNNTGKSSVLEALRLYTQNAAPAAVYGVLLGREQHVGMTEDEDSPDGPESALAVSPLFYGFPRFSAGFEPIVISTHGRTGHSKLTIRVEWYMEERDLGGNRQMIRVEEVSFEEPSGTAMLVVETGLGGMEYPIERLARYARQRQWSRPKSSNIARMPSVLISPYGEESTNTLGPLWDGIALTSYADDVVEALRIIDPKISDVSMLGGAPSTRRRTAMARAENIDHPVPLRSFGDGLNRIFAIMLSLVNSRGGLLLIDEFENGLHYSVQLDAWRMIFELARKLDVQVFATSHSWDAVETFQKAAAETPEEGALLRLTRRGDNIIPTVFVEEELSVATRHKIEVR